MRRTISPWEYHHLRALAGVRIASGVVLTGLSVVTLTFGGNDGKTCGWAAAFLAVAANLAFGYCEITIASGIDGTSMSSPRHGWSIDVVSGSRVRARVDDARETGDERKSVMWMGRPLRTRP
jgi:hypothetical protein